MSLFIGVHYTLTINLRLVKQLKNEGSIKVYNETHELKSWFNNNGHKKLFKFLNLNLQVSALSLSTMADASGKFPLGKKGVSGQMIIFK